MVVITNRPKGKGKGATVLDAHVNASSMVEEQYQNFDVVWSKLGSYAWWPAVLFYSWEAVNDAGLDLKAVQDQLVIPPPTMKPLPDGRERLVYSVLIMFLDKFNCNVIEVSPKTVCPFALNFARLHKPKNRSGAFNVALQRAMRLLHMDNHMAEEELDSFAPIRADASVDEELPVQVKTGKKRRKTAPAAASRYDDLDGDEDKDEDDVDFGDDSVEEEEDAPEQHDAGSDYTDGEDDRTDATRRAPKKKHGKKAPRKASIAKQSSKQAAASLRVLDLSAGYKKGKPARSSAQAGARYRREAIEPESESESESDFEIVNINTVTYHAPAKPKESGKKASRKEGRVHHQEIIDVDDDDDSSGGFDIQVQSAKKSVKPPAKVKPSKNVKVKIKTQSEPHADKKIVVKLKRNTKPVGSNDDVEYVAKVEKKKKSASAKRQSHESHSGETKLRDGAGSHSEAQARAPPKKFQPLTMTPLSSIWTTREKTSGSDIAKENLEANADTDASAAEATQLAYKLDLLWDEAHFSDEDPQSSSFVDTLNAAADSSAGSAATNGERGVGKRQVRSVQQSQIRQSMMAGNLDPHTMVQCESYLPKGGGGATVDTSTNRSSRGASPQFEAPFQVVVHPDVVFVCDLHSHLATCEIIGFLGGRWDEATKTIHIQAAFPCRSLEIEGDDGSTDVEMDPESEIELREIIRNAELEVVGWYHSHPAFAPDPSIRDIENQTSYQSLFQRRKDLGAGRWEVSEPFVGLIVGTYDPRRESPVGLFRFFHTRGERVNSGMRQEVPMPYELVPRKRYYRTVVEDEKRERLLRPSSVEPTVAKSQLMLTDGAHQQKETQARGGGRPKKRKGSADLAFAGGPQSAVQPVKKRRGRQPKSAVVVGVHVQEQVQPHSATNGSSVKDGNDAGTVPKQEIVDLISDPSHDFSLSAEQLPSAPAIESIGGRLGGIIEENLDKMAAAELAMASTPQLLTSAPSESASKPSSARADDDDGMVDESSQSQGEIMVVGDSIQAIDTLVEKTEPIAIEHTTPLTVAEPNREEEIVEDSSQSQDSHLDAVVSRGDIDGDSPLLANGNGATSLAGGVDDLVLASASSSSMSEASYSFDASQSQTTTQSQPSSQVEEAAARIGVVANAVVDEDDPYADIEIIPSRDRSPVVKASVKARAAVHLDSSVRHSGRTPESMPTLSAHDAADKTLEAGGSKSGDVVVGDFAPESSLDSAQPTQDERPQEGDGTTTPSPVEEDSGLNSGASGGGSTPVDPSLMPMGRRRTRKPSLTTRIQGSLTERTDISPHSSRQLNPSPSENVDVGLTSHVDRPATAYAETNTQASRVEAVKNAAADESGWYGIEIIHDDYVQASPQNEADSAAVKEEGVQATPELVVPRDDAHELMNTSTNATVKSDAAAGSMEAAEADLTEEAKEVVKSEFSQHVKAVAGDAQLAVLSQDPDLDGADPKQPRRQKREKRLKLQAYSLGTLLEPLEQYQVENLRKAIAGTGIMKTVPKEDQKKKHGYIAAIRAFWADQQRSGGTATASTALVPQPNISHSGGTTVSEIEDMDAAIFEETTRIVEELVAAVEAGGSGPASGPDPVSSALIKTEVPSSTNPVVVAFPPSTVSSSTTEPLAADSKTEPTTTAVVMKKPSLQERHALHLKALRLSYGPGVYGCTEQVVTLIDYYRDFQRRTDLNEIWRAKTTKLEKIAASLRADVELVNLPVALRDAYIQDVIGYLRTSWKLSGVSIR